MQKIKAWFIDFFIPYSIPGYIWPFLLAGTILRITGLTSSAIWYDEAITLNMTRLPLIRMVQVAMTDFNPPLWELVVYPFVKVFGANAFAIRLPALLASLASLWLAWLIVKELITPKPARMAAMLLVSLLPMQAWIAQDGRVYALAGMLYLLAFWLMINRRWLGYATCLSLLAYSHALAGFYILALFLAGMLYWGRGSELKIYLSLLAMVIIYAPWATSLAHAALSSEFDLAPLTFWSLNYALVFALVGMFNPSAAIQALGVVVIDFSLLSCLFFTAWQLWVLWASHIKKEPAAAVDVIDAPINTAIGALAAVPLLLMIAVSPIENVIIYRSLTITAIPMLIWYAGNLTPRRLTWTTWILPYTWLAVLVAALLSWSPVMRGGSLADQASLINQQWQPGDVVYHATATSELPMDLYLDPATHPTYLLDEFNPDGLLRRSMQDAFGLQRGALENIPYRRAWIIWARDPVETQPTQNRMAAYVQGATLVGTINYIQMAPVQIWLKEER
jgi:hypothetical protein